ncbi:uncharacterized protein LOC142323637 isoform X2 [Lycorma delicatula]|uniref:uncharacterized protein LOC142323637 isoform X2 n=1 Tax=Lycorma delicatula TaxID=130591 RepID=UPI003F50E41F
MVVRGGRNNNYTIISFNNIIYPDNAVVKKNTNMAGKAVLICRSNSHPFQDRTLTLDQPVKIGRSVARARAAPNNGIFDCKVLSRNHALFWYSSGKFFLQDTKSSNGTFVNNQRLSMSGDESPPREVCSGDIVQFGVDVLENSRKVTHGCIVANLKLYLPDGKEAKARTIPFLSPSSSVISSVGSVPIEDLYQLNQNIQEALQREQMLETKIASLQKMVAALKQAAELGWKALINEDRLLSRVEILENQLQMYSKNFAEDKLREELRKLQEDKNQYQGTAKEFLRKILEEKLDAVKKCQDVEQTLKNTETECSNLRELMRRSHEELQELAQKHSQQVLKTEELHAKLQETEEQHKEAVTRLEIENEDLMTRLEKSQANEATLHQRIEELEASGELAQKQLMSLQRQLQNVNTISSSLSSPVLNLKNSSDSVTEIIGERNEKSEEETGVNEMMDILLQRYTAMVEEQKRNKEVVALLNAQIELLHKEKVSKLQDINNLERTVEMYSSDVSHCKKENRSVEELISSLPPKVEKNLHLPVEIRNRSGNGPHESETINRQGLIELLAESREKTEEAERILAITQMELVYAKESYGQTTENWLLQEEKLREAMKLQEEHEASLQLLKDQMSCIQSKEVQKKQMEKLDVDQETTNKDFEEIESLKQQLLDAQQMGKQSRNEIELMRDKLSVLELLQQKREEGSDEISMKLNSTQQELNNKKKEGLMLENCINCLEKQVSMFHEEVESLKSELRTAVEDKNKAEEHLARLTKCESVATTEEPSDRSIIQDLEEKVTQLSEKVVYHKEQYMKLLEEKTSIAGELHKLRIEYESITHHPYFHTMFAIPLLILFFCTVIKFYPFLSSVLGTAEPTFAFTSSDESASSQVPPVHDNLA